MFQLFSLLIMSTTLMALSVARISEYIPSSVIEDHLGAMLMEPII